MISFLLLLLIIIGNFSHQLLSFPIEKTKCFENCGSYEIERLKYANESLSEDTCKFCYAAMPLAKFLVQENKTQHFPELARIFCDIFKIIDESVCNLAVKEFQVFSSLINLETKSILILLYH